MSESHFSKRKVGGEEAMAGLYAQCAGSVTGGSSVRAVSGVQDIKDYANSVMSKAKEQLIRDIARDMKDKLKVENGAKTKLSINPDADLPTLISQLKAAIPDPRTNGRTWSDKLGSQKSACKKLAQIINNHYGYARGETIIDENAAPEEICDKVSEVMYTLFTGLHTEFLNVREDALRLSKNLHLLEEILKRNFNHMIAKMQGSDPESVMAETKLAREGHEMIMKEIALQHAMLDNTLNIVISPEDKELTKLLKQSKDFKRLVKSIKSLPGSGKFGEKVAYVLSGVGTTAQMAQSVNEALKKTQMSLAEYSKPKDVKELEESIFNKLREKMNRSSAKDLETYLSGARTLMRYEYNRPEIIAELSKRGGDGEDEDEETRGAEEDTVKGGLRLDKRVKEREDLKKALVMTFNKQLGGYLERINTLTERIARATGTTVPVTDALRQFTKRLELIPDIEKRNVFFALTGYYNDPTSKEERGLFLDNAKAMCESLEKMLKMSEYSKNEHIRDLLRAWQGVISLINDYGERFEKGFGYVQPKAGPSKFGQAEDSILGGGPWWTAAQKALEKAGVKGDEEQGKIYHDTIKPGLIELKEKGELDWDKFVPAVEALVEKATGKKVSIEGEKALEAEIKEAQERLAAKAASPEGSPVVPGKAPKAKAPAKAKGKKSHKKSHKRGRGEDDDDDDDESSYTGAEEAEEIMGGAITGAEITRMADNLTRSKDIMRFFFRAADIRKNLAYVAPELKEYGKDYEKVLGDAVARERDRLTGEMDEDLKKYKLEFEEKDDAANGISKGDVKQGSLTEYLFKQCQVADWKDGKKIKDSAKQNFVDAMKEIYEFRKKFWTTKIDMLRCAEAMDLYMKHFTDGIVANIEDVQKIEVMLRGTEIISKWFSSKSGNLICSVFDTFPSQYKNADAVHSNLPSSWDAKGLTNDKIHYYWRVQGACRLVGSPKDVSDNIVEAIQATSSDDAALKALQEHYKSNKADANWTNYNKDNKKIQADGAPADAVMPGIPYMGLAPIKEFSGDVFMDKRYTKYDDLKKKDAMRSMEYVTKAFENVSVLKNILAAFVAIGDRFGGQDIRKKIHMSPMQIYEFLIRYMTVGSYQMGIGGTPGKDSDFTFGAGSAVGKNWYVTMRHCNDATQAKFTGVSDPIFKRESDQWFVLVVKAMVAKILTVIGVYNMIHQPIDRNALGYSSAVRWTIGGVDAYPKIIPEALELYVRLPLLAEFYRDTFDFWSENNTLAMVPHMEGTFQGLVELIFDRARHIKYGTYSDTDSRTMIEEINKIYMAFKGGKNPVSDAIHEFVAEINRRYGILVGRERQRYQRMETERYADRRDESYESAVDRVDYDILPEERGSLVGPSDSYLTRGLTPNNVSSHKWTMRLDTHMGFINALRSKLDSQMDKLWPADNKDPRSVDGLERLKQMSFENLIKSRREELKYARSAKEQFHVVQQAINGLGEFSMNSLERSLILFHETVVTGLNTLTALYSMVKAFHSKIWKMSNTIELIHNKYNGNTMPAQNATSEFVVDVKENDTNELERGSTDYCRNISAGTAGTQQAYAYLNTAGGDLKNKQRVAKCYHLEADKLMQDLVDTLYAHTSTFDGLVDFQIETVDHSDVTKDWLKAALEENKDAVRPKTFAMSMDHSKLYELVDRELRNIRLMLDRFRGLIPKNIIDMYEASGDQKGTIYWLEKNFVQDLLAGKSAKWMNQHLGAVNEKLRIISDGVTKPWNFVSDNSAAINIGSLRAGLTAYEQYNLTSGAQGLALVGSQILRTLSAVKANSPSIFKALRDLNDPTFALLKTPEVKNVSGLYPISGGVVTKDIIFNNLAGSQGVVVRFNQLVANYLKQCFDEQSEKIYVNTINNFANGAFSDAVMKDQSLDDFAGAINNASVTDGKVLFKSLALIMRQLLTAKMKGKTFKHYAETDLAEVPLFIKEGFRANMPVFTKMFNLLVKRCELLKRFAEVGVEKTAKDNIVLTCNQVIIGCNSLVSCMRDVLDELADSPTYFETHKDSIKEYEMSNGVKPMMPLSAALWGLHELEKPYGTVTIGGVQVQGVGSHPEFFPSSSLGLAPFKWLYGTRGVFAQTGDYSYGKVSGMKDILQKHNETTESEYHLDDKVVASHTQDTLLALRFVYDVREYAAWMCSKPSNGLYFGSTLDHVDPNRSVYSVRNKDLSTTLQLIESNRQRDSRQAIVSIIEKSDNTIVRGTREQIRMMNIIDMNLVPVNISALMREIPMVNLLNYSYTYDSMICSLLGIDRELIHARDSSKANEQFAEFLKATPQNERSKKFMGLMLLHPFMDIDRFEYDNFFGRIIRGGVGITGLGRPKFLGDELYNKALFGEIYSNMGYYDEAGPMVGESKQWNRQDSDFDGTNKMIGLSELRAKVVDAASKLRTDFGRNNIDLSDTGLKNIAQANAVGRGNNWGALTDEQRSRWVVNANRSFEIILDSFIRGADKDELARMSQTNPIPDHDVPTNTITKDNAGLQQAELQADFWEKIRNDGFAAYRNAEAASYIQPRQPGPSDDYLNYMHTTKDGKNHIVRVHVGKNKTKLQAIGKLRFDTFYVRSLVWLTNIQRVLRLKLRNDLDWYDAHIVRDNQVTTPDITEQYGNDSHPYKAQYFTN